jgi:hypothetical protein
LILPVTAMIMCGVETDTKQLERIPGEELHDWVAA